MPPAEPAGTATNPATSSRDAHLDVLRGVAILALMLEHAIVIAPGLAPDSAIFALATRLGTGVQIFFVLSGYLISASLDRARAAGEGLGPYFRSRAAKILPLYLLFLHLNMVVHWVLSATLPSPVWSVNSMSAGDATAANYLAHLLFLQGLMPQRLHSLLDGSWSIACEVYFYLLYPALHRFIATPARTATALALSLLVAALFAKAAAGLPNGFGYYGFPSQAPCFLIGAYCWQLRRAGAAGAVRGQHAAAVVACVLLLFFGVSKSSTAPLGVYLPLMALFAVVVLFCRFDGSGPLQRQLAWLGGQSYALFFLHVLLMKTLFVILASLAIGTSALGAFIANVVIGIGASLLLSVLVFDRLDRACVAWARRRA